VGIDSSETIPLQRGNSVGRKIWKAFPAMLLPEFAPLKGGNRQGGRRAAGSLGNPKDFQ
jgi:hypothetical protein